MGIMPCCLAKKSNWVESETAVGPEQEPLPPFVLDLLQLNAYTINNSEAAAKNTLFIIFCFSKWLAPCKLTFQCTVYSAKLLKTPENSKVLTYYKTHVSGINKIFSSKGWTPCAEQHLCNRLSFYLILSILMQPNGHACPALSLLPMHTKPLPLPGIAFRSYAYDYCRGY